MIPYRELTIDLNPQLLPPEPLLTASQYDNGRPVRVKVQYNGEDFDLTGMTAQISVRKPSGKVVIANAQEVTGSTVIFNLITQMTAEYGMIPTEISLTGQNQDPIGTANWITYVEKSPSSGSPSDTWVQDLDEKVEQATEAAEAAEVSEINAEAWAVGERGGVPVTELDPTYHNNSKYWAEYAEGAVQDVTELVERAETAAGAAADSATESAGYASDSAASATASAGSAAESAGYATQSSQHATNSANSATASASSASASAQSAGQSAASATESAGYATQSENYAGIAAGASEAAGQSATAAAGSASTAAGHATNAANSATASAGSATQSAQSATASATSAGQAAGSATAAAGSADAADASADRAQEILDSIPEDYSELSDDVADLKSAIDEVVKRVTYPQLLNKAEFIDGKALVTTASVATPDDMVDDPNSTVTNLIELTWSATDGNRVFETNLKTGEFQALGYYYRESVGKYVRSGNTTIVTAEGDHYKFSMPEINVKMRITLRTLYVDPKDVIITKAGEWTTDPTYGSDVPVVNDGLVRMSSLDEELSEMIDPVNPCHYNGDSVQTFKKFLCIGDSLTEGTFDYTNGGVSATFVDADYSYPTIFAAITGRDVTNKGDGGETFASWYTGHSGDDLSGHDCAIIELGLNDSTENTASADRLVAMGNIVTKLKTENPGIKIFFSTIFPCYSNSHVGEVNEDIINFVDETQDCWLLNLMDYSDIQAETAYVAGHLTAIGYEKLAREYANYISCIIDGDKNSFMFIQYIGTNRTQLVSN